MADLDSCQYIWQPTLVLTCVKPCHTSWTPRWSTLTHFQEPSLGHETQSVYLVTSIGHLMSNPVPNILSFILSLNMAAYARREWITQSTWSLLATSFTFAIQPLRAHPPHLFTSCHDPGT